MKMIKAMKKLKFWSRKKKRKKPYEPFSYYQTNPSSCHQHCCSYSTSTQPSAPPLPPWLDLEQTEETLYAAAISTVQHFPEMPYPSQTQFTTEEVTVETSLIYPTLLPVNSSTSSSYQHYMVPNPVYGLPVVQAPERERSSGFFGCFVNFGVNFIRCFCPCLSIREAYQDSKHEHQP